MLAEPGTRQDYVPSARVFEAHRRDQYSYERPSDAEFQDRWRKIRAFMDRRGLDVLLIAGGTGTWDRNWTNTRWAAGHVGCQLTSCGYVVFTREGEPTVLAYPLNAHLPARRAREVVEDVRAAANPHVAAVQRIREAGATLGTIGVVEMDLTSSIPSTHLDHFREALPDARFEMVTRDWWMQVRLQRSAEEIAFLERAAMIGDAMNAAIPATIRAGMSEREVFACLSDAMIKAGGEIPTMVLAASGSSYGVWDTLQRERPMNRVLWPGDVILTELAPRYPDGSECQTGRTYVLGDLSPLYRELEQVMMTAYERICDQLRPGRTDADVIKAAEVITDAGFTTLAPLMHGAEGGGAGALPMIAPQFPQPEAEPFTFQPNMVVCVEVHVGLPDNSAGLLIVDTWATTEGDPRCLNRYPHRVITL